MKVGDWVVHEDGRVGKITVMHFDVGFHLVMYDNTFARNTHQKFLTVLEPAVGDILTAVQHNEEK